MDTVYTNVITDRQNVEIEKTVRRERGRLLNFIRKRVRTDDVAEDILQEVLGQLTQAYRRLETIERVTSWLFQVARHKIADTYRKKRPTSLPSANRGDGRESTLDDTASDLSQSPERMYIRDTIWSEIASALDDLPPAHRDVFVWHEFDGMSFRDMAELTGESPNALRLRKHQAVRSLRERLGLLYNEVRRDR